MNEKTRSIIQVTLPGLILSVQQREDELLYYELTRGKEIEASRPNEDYLLQAKKRDK